jgi:hypothetical protein
MKHLLIAAIALVLPACASASGTTSSGEHAGAVAEADSKDTKPHLEQCDLVRANAITGLYGKPCEMTTSRGQATVTFDSRTGYPTLIEGVDITDGRSRRVEFANWSTQHDNIVLAVHTTLWETLPDQITDVPLGPLAGYTYFSDSRGRPYFETQVSDFEIDFVHHHTGIIRKTPSNLDICDIWWKSAEGSMMTALVQHTDGASKKYQAWWDGKSTFPLKCGRFTGEADLSQFKEVLDRYSGKAETDAFTDSVYRKFGLHNPAAPGFNGNVRTSIFEILHKAHIAANGWVEPGTIMEGIDTTDPAGQMLWTMIQGFGAAFVAGAAAGGAASLATSETGPPAIFVGVGTAQVVLAGALTKALIDQLQIQQQLKRERERDEKKNGPNSDNDQTDSDGDGIPDSEDPDADGDGIQDSEQDFGMAEALADNDAKDDGAVNTDGSSDPSGGTWDDGTGGINPPDDPWGGNDPWCPAGDCDNHPSVPTGIVPRPFPAL